jgi:hypothetical protein
MERRDGGLPSTSTPSFDKTTGASKKMTTLGHVDVEDELHCSFDDLLDQLSGCS